MDGEGPADGDLAGVMEGQGYGGGGFVGDFRAKQGVVLVSFR